MEPLGLGAVLVTAQYVAIHPQPSYNLNSLVFFLFDPLPKSECLFFLRNIPLRIIYKYSFSRTRQTNK